MLVLLPPSEGKAAGGSGGPVELDGLSWAAALGPARRRVGDALATLCGRHPARARAALGLSVALDGDRAANAELWTSPTTPAGARYAGVLHDALGHPTLGAAARRRADRSLVVLSGLWGATRPTDLIPAYRIGIGTTLPRIGALPTFWRPALHAALDELVVDEGALDLRSAGYSQMYRPSPAAAARLVTVRITGPDGSRAAPSYASKVAKGRLVRGMLGAGAPSVERLIASAPGLGLEAASTDAGVVVTVPAGWPAPSTLRG